MLLTFFTACKWPSQIELLVMNLKCRSGHANYVCGEEFVGNTMETHCRTVCQYECVDEFNVIIALAFFIFMFSATHLIYETRCEMELEDEKYLNKGLVILCFLGKWSCTLWSSFLRRTAHVFIFLHHLQSWHLVDHSMTCPYAFLPSVTIEIFWKSFCLHIYLSGKF